MKYTAHTTDGMKQNILVDINSLSYYDNRQWEHEPTKENMSKFLKFKNWDEIICIEPDTKKLSAAHTPLYIYGWLTVAEIRDENNNIIFNHLTN